MCKYKNKNMGIFCSVVADNLTLEIIMLELVIIIIK